VHLIIRRKIIRSNTPRVLSVFSRPLVFRSTERSGFEWWLSGADRPTVAGARSDGICMSDTVGQLCYLRNRGKYFAEKSCREQFRGRLSASQSWGCVVDPQLLSESPQCFLSTSPPWSKLQSVANRRHPNNNNHNSKTDTRLLQYMLT